MNTFIAPPTSICGIYVSTQPPPAGYQELNVCFWDQLRSFGNHNVSKFQQQIAVLERRSLAVSQLLSGCHSSMTVLTANTTQINEICTPRNLFLMVRVATLGHCKLDFSFPVHPFLEIPCGWAVSLLWISLITVPKTTEAYTHRPQNVTLSKQDTKGKDTR